MSATREIAVLGAGRLGLCWALCAEAAGHSVVAVDVFPSYVHAINSKQLVSHEPHVAEMLAAATRLRATTSVAEAATAARMLFIFVQTPSSGGDRHYDHSHLSDVLGQLNALRVQDKHIVICCTVMPGYCATIAPSLLRDCRNVLVSYSPAFIAQGEIVAGILTPDMVLVGAATEAARTELEAVHAAVVGSARARTVATLRHGSAAAAAANAPALRRMSPASAEIAKLALNCFVTLKIAFANFVADVADATDASATEQQQRDVSTARGDECSAAEAARVDKYAILEALGCDSRVGSKCLLPGYGFGGPCFPRDNRALAEHARKVGVDTSVPEATDASNGAHARAQAAAIVGGLARAGVAPSGSRAVRFADVAYKPRCPVPIVQESQKLRVAALVRDAGHAVLLEDSAAVLEAVRREHGSRFRYREREPAAAESAPPDAAAADEVDGESFLSFRAGAAKRARLEGAHLHDGMVLESSDVARLMLAAERRGEGRRSLPTSFTH